MGYVYKGAERWTPEDTPTSRVLRPCGTYAAWCRHKYHGEEIDLECAKAKTAYDREQTEKKRLRREGGYVPKPRKPKQPCGTYAASQRHYRDGEPLCEPCKAAKSEYETAKRAATFHPKPEAECGTYAGAVKHRREGEKVCDPCRLAQNEYQKQYRRKRKKTRGRMTSRVPNGTIYTQEKASA